MNFQKVKTQVAITDVLTHYGLNDLKRKADELVGACPFGCGHSKTNKRLFSANTSKNNFQCFGCKLKGNVIDFVVAKENCSVRDAALKLTEWFKVDSGNGDKGQSRGVEKKENLVAKASNTTSLQTGCGKEEKEKIDDTVVINPVLHFALKVDGGHKYGIERGLSDRAVKYFECGLCLSKGLFAGRYVFPLHNERGEFVGYVGRAVDSSEPKYMLPPIEKGFRKSHLLFNLHRVLADFADSNYVVLVEGVFDVIRVYQSGFPAVALLGSSISDEQVRLLQKYFTSVIVLLDGDDKGKKAVGDIVTKLACNDLYVKAVMLNGVDPGEMGIVELREVLTKK